MDEKKVREMRRDGKSYNDVARAVGETRDNVRNYCRKMGLDGRRSGKGQEPLTSSEVTRRVAEAGNDVAYVGGYTTNTGKVVVMCNKCGEVFERSYGQVTQSKVACPGCAKLEREAKALIAMRDAAKRRNEKEQAAKMQREREKERKALRRIAVCHICGSEFSARSSRGRYCSLACRKKGKNKKLDSRIPSDKVIDKDITLEGLYRRDGGTCYLCGGACNREDYVVVDGTTICGDWYPSIDHVMPIARGGEHSWANIRLAHRRCNTIKSDNILPH